MVRLLTGNEAENFGQLGRELVEDRYCWADKIAMFSALLGEEDLRADDGGMSVRKEGEPDANSLVREAHL